MTQPFSLDDEMLDRLTAAAGLLPPHARDGFLRSVAGQITHLPRPEFADLERAIGIALAARGVTQGPPRFRASRP
jgi:hypothetical protein